MTINLLKKVFRAAGAASWLLMLVINAGAYVPPVVIENPEVGNPLERLGESVAVDGGTMIVGAPGTNFSGINEAGTALVFERDGGGQWQLETQLFAPNKARNDQFGDAVAISGDTAVVGEPFDDFRGNDTGSVFVYTRSGGVWSLQQNLAADIAEIGGQFGNAVALDEETLVVGSYRSDGAATDSGAAYIFTRSNGMWTLQAKLSAADGSAYSHFGYSAAVSGDTVVVGALVDDAAGTDAGAAYIFTRSGAVWTQQAKLTAADAAAGAHFGASVGVSGDTAIVGADLAHSAYVFTRTGVAWAQQAKLTPAGTTRLFGFSVAVAGDTAVIGSPNGGVGNFGEAYIFTRSGDAWTQQQNLTEAFYEFGFSIAISGQTIVAGAPRVGGLLGSAVLAYERANGVWSPRLEHIESGENFALGDKFGASIAVSGDTVVIGAPQDGLAGAAYIYMRQGADWILQAKLQAADTAPVVEFGAAVAIDGDTAAIGAPRHTNGSVFVFTRANGVWSQQQKLTAADHTNILQYGSVVALSGDTLIVGVPINYWIGTSPGEVQVFMRTGGVWSRQQTLTASGIDAAGAYGFGVSLAISGATLLGGAFSNDGGRAFVFMRENGVWSQRQKLAAANTNQFGRALAISGDAAVIGSTFEMELGFRGAAYIFMRSGETWSEEAKLTAAAGIPYDEFGRSVAIRDDVVLIGSSDSTYIFERSGGSWSERRKLTVPAFSILDSFGAELALQDDWALICAPTSDAPEIDSGVVYAFPLINVDSLIDYLLGFSGVAPELDLNLDSVLDVADGVLGVNQIHQRTP